jgi:N-acetylmuramoyl-L-alanine amidase
MRSFAERLARNRAARLLASGAVLLAWILLGTAPARAASAESMYTSALARERQMRDAEHPPTLKQIRSLAATYVRIPARYPRSGYSDNALWQAAGLYAMAWERFGDESDRRRARRALERMKAEYPASSLIRRSEEIARLLEPRPAVVAARDDGRRAATVPVAAVSAPAAARAPAATLLGITRSDLGPVVRLTFELDAEITYTEEELSNPSRLFFDLGNVKVGPKLSETPVSFEDPVIPQVRIGLRPQGATRVAVDLDGVSRYSVFTLYNPYRLVVDFERSDPPPAVPPAVATSSPAAAVPPPPAPSAAPAPLPSKNSTTTMTAAPTVPSANTTGAYSLARQLGLGVGRIVIDPGHGGHDPGASANRVTEAELVLDIALRLEKLLAKVEGLEVVLTRRTDKFIPLEERTAIANRAGADLFLSIHANASRNKTARGVETYYLNFASNSEAEAVAARENSASSSSMHQLPDIIRAIALNDKLDESRDFAELVQNAMARRLRAQNKSLKSLGVKRAPFVVLIGAGMPSVLAEISFVTNREEAALLRTGTYRQRIAQALFDGITQYQQSLKKVTAIAATR